MYRCQQRPEESTGSLGIGVACGFESPVWVLRTELSASARAMPDFNH